MADSALRPIRRAALAAMLMLASALLAWVLTPRTAMSTLHGEFTLEQAVPRQFGDWHMETLAPAAIVNPQQEAKLSALYSQILSRVYVNGRGQRVMLSIAYGNDQRDGMQLHYPEVCYPAQGFQLLNNRPVDLQLGGIRIPARQLETLLGTQRYEPVTYWTIIGEKAVRGGVEKKLAELGYGLQDLIPDGLLFRISSIDRSAADSFALQQEFAGQMVLALDPQSRKRLTGS
jgi:EpsI family protein